MRRMVFGALAAVAVAVAMLTARPASAHNAGHIFLPSGECLEIGSNK